MIINNSANINKLNHHFVPLNIEHKKEHHIYGEGNQGPGLRQALNVLEGIKDTFYVYILLKTISSISKICFDNNYYHFLLTRHILHAVIQMSDMK